MTGLLPRLLCAVTLAFWCTLGVFAPAWAQTGGTGSANSTGGSDASSSPNAAGTGTAVGLIQTDANARVDFGNAIQFQLRAVSVEPISNVLFLYQVDQSNVQNTGVPTYQPGAAVTATYTWRVAGVLAPGSEVRYQWLIETSSGKKLTTAEQSITYNDTRFTWREARGDQVVVYFRDGDATTGQALLDEATRAENQLSQQFGLTAERPLRVYAYTRQQDLVGALGGRPADAAITIGTDRIFVLAPSGTSAMPAALKSLHREVASAIFAQKTNNPYADPPRWLAEGFALYTSGEELTQDYYKALQQLAQQNKLLPLRTLNGNFPNADRDRALATVESLSAVKFIVDTYGSDKMRSLLAAFKEGTTVDDAVKKGLGVTLDQFETRWKNYLKSGNAAKSASSQRSSTGQNTAGNQGSGAGNGAGDQGGFLDRAFGPAIQFWQRIFGAYTRPVLLGSGALIGVGLLSVIGFSVVGAVRRANAEEE